jgi:chromosome segregation ATPase
MSKIILMKNFLDKTIEKLNEKNDINNKNIENNYKIIKDILDKIKSLSDLINNEINNDNEDIKNIFGYIIKLINEFFVSKNKYILDSVDINIKNNDFENKSDIEKFEKILDELVNLNKKYKLDYIKIKEQNESLIKEIDDIKNQNTDIINLKSQFETEKNELLQNLENSDTKYKNLENEYNILNEESTKMISELNILKENELKNNSSLENELKIKNEQITNLQKLNSDLNNKVKELNKKIIELNNQIQDLENKKNNYVDINESIKNSELMKIMANHDAELKKLGNDLMNQNKTEIKNLENKLKSLQAKYDMILIECSNLKKNIIYLKGKKYDPDSYEEVLKEQFETMRNAFVIKIDDLNEELTSIKRESRVKIYQLELDLKENIKLKNTFLKQIISLQSQLDALNKE